MASLLFSFSHFPGRHNTSVRSSSERQLLFNRIAPAYDNVNSYFISHFLQTFYYNRPQFCTKFSCIPPLVLSAGLYPFIYKYIYIYIFYLSWFWCLRFIVLNLSVWRIENMCSFSANIESCALFVFPPCTEGELAFIQLMSERFGLASFPVVIIF